MIGAIIMIGYMCLIAAKLDALPLWICVLVGLAQMVWGFWWDDWKPVLTSKKK